MPLKLYAMHLWRGWIRPLAVVVLVVGSFRSAVADWNDVPTGSMKPTILEGDRIVVNKLAYDLKLPFTALRLLRWGEPQRGDIVVLYSPADGIRLVKRVVGLPGDRVAMRSDRLVVNGQEVTYEPLKAASIPGYEPARTPRVLAVENLPSHHHAVMITPGTAALRSFGPIVVPDGDYFVMGDNRDESADSRVFGFVPRDAIVGRATAVAASVNPSRHYLPRWQRFFHALH
jgi:signal peptidase I